MPIGNHLYKTDNHMDEGLLMEDDTVEPPELNLVSQDEPLMPGQSTSLSHTKAPISFAKELLENQSAP